MSVSAAIANTISIGSFSFVGDASESGDNIAGSQPSLPVAKVGQLTTRTDANTGTLTMAASHGITTGQIISIYWTESDVAGARHQVTVGTVSVNSVPIDLGTGDDLPTNLTAITAQVQLSEAVTINGDTLQALAAQFRGAPDAEVGRVDFYEGGVSIFAVDLDAGEIYRWEQTNGGTSPLAGAVIDEVRLTHKSSSAAQEVTVAAIYN